MNIIDLIFAVLKDESKPEYVEYANIAAMKRDDVEDDFMAWMNDSDRVCGEMPDEFERYMYSAFDPKTFDAEELSGLIFERAMFGDAYGGGVYRLKQAIIEEYNAHELADKYFYLMDTYGDDDSERHDYPGANFGEIQYPNVFTACVVTFNLDGPFERIDVADFYMRGNGQLYVARHHMTDNIPQLLYHHLLNRNIVCKRAFYFYPKDKAVSLRCQQQVWDDLPELHHEEFSPDSKNHSSPRIILRNLEVVV